MKKKRYERLVVRYDIFNNKIYDILIENQRIWQLYVNEIEVREWLKENDGN